MSAPTMSPADQAAHEAASHVRPVPKAPVLKAPATEPLSDKAAALLARIEDRIAGWER